MAPSNPLFLAWCAITRKAADGKVFRPDLAVSRHTALRAITIDAAYSWRMEDKIGSIKPGKNATFTILKQNPYMVAVDELKDITVRATVFNGKIFPVD
jgi:predicted amidohydrolase YtcJ